MINFDTKKGFIVLLLQIISLSLTFFVNIFFFNKLSTEDFNFLVAYNIFLSIMHIFSTNGIDTYALKMQNDKGEKLNNVYRKQGRKCHRTMETICF